MFETQLDEICLFPLQNKKNSFTFDDKKADEVPLAEVPPGCGTTLCDGYGLTEITIEYTPPAELQCGLYKSRMVTNSCSSLKNDE